LAARGSAPVYAVAGAGSRDAVQDLRLSDGVALVDSPRAANLFLVAGSVGTDHADALARAHDALPHPRATVLWNSDAGGLTIPGALVADPGSSPVPSLRAVFRDLIEGRRPSEAALLPDEDPAPWQGVGPYGQGGTGMTGGTPYGRPMAELGPDRDGLRLDVLPTMVGPFFAPLPTGLVLDLRVAGDVIVGAGVTAASLGLTSPTASVSPFVRALTEPVSIADLELARARDHLRWVAEALRVQGLPALGLRALALANRVEPGPATEIRRLGATIGRTGVYRWSLAPAAGRLVRDLPGLALGPVSRAAGLSEDARLDDPAYRALGFEPIVSGGDTTAARWRLRLDEAARSLEVAARAGGAQTTPAGVVEGPRGRLALGDDPWQRAMALIPALLDGLEWGDAISALVSLDIRPDEVAFVANTRPVAA
jgi:hypothetical protein